MCTYFQFSFNNTSYFNAACLSMNQTIQDQIPLLLNYSGFTNFQ